MPSADVVVVGCGLSGLTAGLALAGAGATVQVVGRGHTTTHWSGGPLDVGAPKGAVTMGAGVAALRARPGHPYAFLDEDVSEAVAWLTGHLAAQGLPYVGDLGGALADLPTSMGRTRPVGLVPDAQSAALRPWSPGEALVVCAPQGFRDLWPDTVAAALRRPDVWRSGSRPERIEPITVRLPGLEDRRNLDSLRIARFLDDAERRARSLDAIARAVRARGLARGRIALPAVLGLDDHAAALADARERLPLEPFEMPLVPPSVPGIRLYRALRAALLGAGGRLQVGEPVLGVELRAGVVHAVALEAAIRSHRILTGALVLATGGIAGGGLVADHDGPLREVVLGLPVEAPPADAWLSDDPFPPDGHPVEAAGVRTDRDLRPTDADGRISGPRDVRVVGSLLAGQRYLRERCGDGVAITSAWRVAQQLAGARVAPTTAGTSPPSGVAAR